MAQTKKTAKNLKFDEYKAIKDDIIEISEQRFENRLLLLEKRINENTDKKLNILEKKINDNTDKKVDSLRAEMRWLIGLLFIVLTSIMTVFKFLG